MATLRLFHRASAGAGALAFGVATALGFGIWQGCNIYGPWLLSSGDGSADNTGDAGVPCTPATPPTRPHVSDDGGAAVQLQIVAAMRSIDIGVITDAGPDGSLPPFGWDMDNVCTCPGPPSCVQAAGTLTNCDDSQGRDHIALELFRYLGIEARLGSVETNSDMNAGQYGILVQVQGYNGMANDARVNVSIFASNGLNAVVDGGTPHALWQGQDNWTIDPGYLNGAQVGMNCDNDNPACVPLYSDDNAYVASNVLVANLTDVPLTFGSRANIGGALMKLTSVILVGELRQVALPGGGEAWGIVNGSISGRWRSSDMLANMATIPDPTADAAGVFFCGNDLFYKVAKAYICALQDITSDPNSDNTNAPCDALSIGFAFASEPARLGTVFGVSVAPAGCKSEAGISWQDSCSQ